MGGLYLEVRQPAVRVLAKEVDALFVPALELRHRELVHDLGGRLDELRHGVGRFGDEGFGEREDAGVLLRVDARERLRGFEHDAGDVGAAVLDEAFGDFEEAEALALVYLGQRFRAGVEEAFDFAPAGIHQSGGERDEGGFVVSDEREDARAEREALGG